MIRRLVLVFRSRFFKAFSRSRRFYRNELARLTHRYSPTAKQDEDELGAEHDERNCQSPEDGRPVLSAVLKHRTENALSCSSAAAGG
jgi:hypothetical protein